MRKKPESSSYKKSSSPKVHKKSASSAPDRADGKRPARPFAGDKGGKRFGDDRPKRSFSEDGDSPRPRAAGNEGKRFGDDRPKRSFGGNGDRPERSSRKDEGETGSRFNKKDFNPKQLSRDHAAKTPGGGRFPERRNEKEEQKAERAYKPARKTEDTRAERPKREYPDREKKSGQSGDRPKRTGDEKYSRPKKDREDRPFRPFKDRNEDKPEGERRSYRDKPAGRPFKPFRDKDGDKPEGERRSFGDKPKRTERPYARRKSEDGAEDARPFRPARNSDGPKREWKSRDGEDGEKKRRSFEGKEDRPKREPAPRPDAADQGETEATPRRSYPKKEDKPIESAMTLNKYIAHSGECSRRDAAELVKQGKVRVNGELVLEPGYRIEPGDQVTLQGKKLTPTKGFVYILLNKPKGFITTTEDPEERKTVMDLVDNAGVGRLYPVGRLDRNTTGLLLMTNDGTLAHKLSHPSYNIRKVYQVTLDKNLEKADYHKITKGVELEDGIAQVDELAYLDDRNELGLEIHSGKNRIVRRIFESLGYTVEKLDRVMYAGLTKKNLPRGKWRELTEKELILLKHFKG